MNKWVLIGGGVFVLAMVLLGHNPAEERRKAKAAKRGSDPLVSAIMEHNKEKGKFSAFGGGTPGKRFNPQMRGNNNTIGPAGAPQQYDQNGVPMPTASATRNGAPNFPAHMMNGTGNPNGAPGENGGPPQGNPNANAYYPPAPAGQAPSELQLNQQQQQQQQPAQQQPQQLQITPGMPQSEIDQYYLNRREAMKKYGGAVLRSGQKIEFAGTAVFTTDKDGKRIPMPDGIYPMYEGTTTIKVKNGRQIIISN